MMSLKVSHSVLINAPPSAVWHVTADVARWADWSPNITAVAGWGCGLLFQDARFDLKQPWQRRRTWIVLRCAAPHSLLLRTAEGDMTALHEVAGTEHGSRSRLTLELTGRLARLARPIFYFALRRENEGLKRRCERYAEGDTDARQVTVPGSRRNMKSRS
jgi:hypothetical protein